MVTRAGWLVVGGSLALIVAGRAFGITELFLLATIGLALVLATFLSVRRRLPRLQVTRSILPTRVQHRGASRVELAITNGGAARSPVLQLHDPVSGTVGASISLAPLAPTKGRSATYRLPTDRRGVVHIGPLRAQLTDPFGLASRRFPIAEATTLTVLPAIEDLARPTGRGGADDPMVGAAHPVPGRSADEDFATLRPYVIGDDLRRVHWSSSARAGDLLVRQDDPPWQGRMTVLLDTRAPAGTTPSTEDERFERAVSAAASLVHDAALRGDQVRLVMGDGTDTGSVDARGAHELLLERLALVTSAPDGRVELSAATGAARSGTLTVVTRTVDEAVRATILEHNRSFGTTAVVVFVDAEPATWPTADWLPHSTELVSVTPDRTFAATWRAAARRRVAR